MLTELAFANSFPAQDCNGMLLVRAVPWIFLEVWTHANIIFIARATRPSLKLHLSALQMDASRIPSTATLAFKFGAPECLAMASDCVCQPPWPFPEGPLQPPQDRWHNIMELRRCYSQFIKSAVGCLSSPLLLFQSFTPYFFLSLQEGGHSACIFIFHCAFF